MRGDWYQISLIFLGVVVTVLFGAFLYREIFPEYKIYQEAYVKLEDFRSSYTGSPPPAFTYGIKQIMIDKGYGTPPLIDRCTSCHVAIQYSHFSPTKIATDSNGQPIFDAEGVPVQKPNEEYVFTKLDQTADAFLAEGKTQEAERLLALKTAQVGEHVYDMTKVLRAHPLIGRETRPFEYHPLDEYGCTICHSGNGRGLTTEKAHGPVFDGDYEEEFTGFVPKFTEQDEENDPFFARIFNHKPGHELLFQTTPLFLGALIQANCVQCHGSARVLSEESPKETEISALFNKKNQKTLASEMDLMTKNYHRGEELFFSQACYACHRIDGLSRGGVGPELTTEGEKYPWFIKESIVWPQADLKTSVMPNFRLDHVEVEDLMTFLLAQRGRGSAVSETSYKSKLLEWEAGHKMPWERPINPGKLHDLNAGMSVFATEGCAACHRLKGFESDVGFAVEAQGAPSFETLYQEREWFQKIIPENIVGSDLVKVLEMQGEEIDARIVDHVRSKSLLEKLEKEHPFLIESFNGGFHFARRAKNHFYQEMSSQAKDPKKKEQALTALQKWQDRVRRVMMMYVQEYGLGRLIAPRPNWSGIYRSDEWLIEHFRKPSRHVAKSIMPVMPFDDSKFYMLTYMLDTLAKRNRDEVRQIWEYRGFDPELAYVIHCSQCHGPHLHGNGPVAEWIYPIPKNLRNAAFLRNLTRENVLNSIVHGVKGTPMPPWGEVAPDKPYLDKIPVLTHQEAVQIVDWLFSSLLGGTVIRNDQDVEKWRYSTEDAVKELEKEGNRLESGPLPEIFELEEIHPKQGALERDSSPLLSSALAPTFKENPKTHVNDIFNIVSNPVEGADKHQYYIKKQYYTEKNLLAGQQYFELNCAVCHGREADGQGYRAGTMYDAKPRMLTNLHWIDTRDDLRLLRSIKYGVPGTSMTPWGDQTSSLQRMQLVMFLRSLNSEQEKRDALFNAIYAAYDQSDQMIDIARIEEYGQINALQDQLKQLKTQEEELAAKVERGEADVNEGVALYKKRFDLIPLLKQHTQADQLLVELKQALKQEGQIYQNIGILLVSKPTLGEMYKQYLNAIHDEAHFTVENGKLISQFNEEKEQKMDQMVKKLSDRLQKEIESTEKERATAQDNEKLENIERAAKSLRSLGKALISGHEEGKKLRQQQSKIYHQYKEPFAKGSKQ